jgi:hypothetical protein
MRPLADLAASLGPAEAKVDPFFDIGAGLSAEVNTWAC